MIAKIELLDEVNCAIHGLTASTRRKLNNQFSFIQAHAYHVPAFKMGRWDGKTSFFTVGGKTFINLLEDILPVLLAEGYEVSLIDNRIRYDIELATIAEDHFSDRVWPEGHPAAGQPVMLRDYQVEIINNFLVNQSSCQEVATGAGKCQPHDSQILTSDGWKPMGEIQTGDQVRTPDGSLSKVLSVYEPGQKDIYEITFKDGRKVKCCLDHIWPVYNIHWSSSTKLGGPIRNITTGDIINHMKKYNGTLGVPLATMENDQTDVDLPMDPWLLGFLLGDGGFRHGTVGFSTADEEIVQKVEAVLHENYKVIKKNNYDYSIVFKSKELQHKAHSKLIKSYARNDQGYIIESGQSGNIYRQILIDLELDHKLSSDKFIPDIYFSGSLHQRKELIRGLVDSDGTVNKGSIIFTSTSKQLADGFARLVYSVGGIAKIKHNQNRTYVYNDIQKDCKDSYDVVTKFPAPWDLISLKRKKDATQYKYQYGPTLKNNIVSVDKVGYEPVKCIYIAHPDHLYLTDNYVVTHNTLITAALSDLIEKSISPEQLVLQCLTHGKSGARTIVIVPNKGLVSQTEEDYINLGLDVGVYFGDRKDYGKTHTICTWQSLEIIQKNFAEGKNDMSLADFTAGVMAVIVDECHGAKAAILQKMLTGPFKNIPVRWGLTGTIPDDKCAAMGIVVGIGQVVGNLAARTLQDDGVLSNCHVDVLQMQDEVFYDNYQTELAYLTTDSDRLDYMAEMILAIAESGNTLVLVDRVKSGKGLLERLPADRTVFVSGEMKNEDRRGHYKEISKEDNKIIVATYGVAAVGINVPRIFNMVLVEPGKSFIRVIQSIGRGLRKADDKDFVNIYDFTSSAKFSKRHLTERKKFYKKAQYPFKITKVNWREDMRLQKNLFAGFDNQKVMKK